MRALTAALLFFCSQYSLAFTLVVGMEEANNAPFEYVDDNVKLTGFHVEIVRQVTHRLGWEVRFQRHPWKWVIKGLKDGEFHAVTYVAKSSEREEFATFLPDNLLHISRSTLYILKKRANEIIYVPPLQHMVTKWRTAMPGGYYINDEVIYMLKNGAPIEQPTVTQNQLFIMLMSGRYDAIFGATSALAIAAEEISGIEKQVKRLEGASFAGTRMYIAFSQKAAAHQAMEFAEAYRQFRDEPAYDRLGNQFGIGELMPEPYEFQ
ncbi:amino acid ABC transporter substrate-binding protein [Hahella sp. CCB-MM4]|nr:amino acid ABC transporter substrate-binding protein [Hahella sp. CCB-MM4]